MLATLISLAVAIFLYFSGFSAESFSPYFLGVVILGIPLVLFLFSGFVWMGTWSPLLKAEQKLTSRVIDLFRKDITLRFTRAFFVVFPLISLFIAFDLWSLHLMRPEIELLVWIVLFGIALDLLNFTLRRIAKYLDPFYVVSFYTHQANRSIQNEDDRELCNWIDALAEVGVKSTQGTGISLATSVCNELQSTARIFLDSSKSISSGGDVKTTAKGVGDEVSYVLYFLLQRLEIINQKAAEQRLETVCSNIPTVIGKITLAAAKCDISLTAYPIQCLGKAALTSQRKGMLEVGMKASLTLVEVAKGILMDNDVTYAELQDPFLSLIAQLSEIARETFRQDKMISIKLLTQPLRDLKELFSSEKMANHPDTPVIRNSIDSALAEFTELETVMRSIPPIPMQ